MAASRTGAPGDAPLPSHAHRLLLNPRYCGRAPYTEHERSVVSLAAFEEARVALAQWPGYAPTPLHSLRGLARKLRVAGLYYKDEGGRFGLGSFKALGGAYGVMRLIEREIAARTGERPTVADLLAQRYSAIVGDITVTTATDGNHGRSVAWGAQLFGCKAVIYIPRQCSTGRHAAIASYGAEVVRTEYDYDNTVRRCAADAARLGRSIVSDTTWPGYQDIPRDVTQGYTVMVEEALEVLSRDIALTHVFVQGGVGALAAAVVGHLWERLDAGRPRVVVVEPSGAACLMTSAQAGRAAACTGPVESVMAGLACGETSPQAWMILERGAFAFMTVADAYAADCMRLLALAPGGDVPIVAGESAIAGLAGLIAARGDEDLSDALELSADSQILVIGTEGATDPSIYRTLVGIEPTEVEAQALNKLGNVKNHG